jgi:hypothetical protein
MKKLVALSIVSALALTVGACAKKDESANVAGNENVAVEDNVTANEAVAVENATDTLNVVEANTSNAAEANTTNSN